MKEEEEESCNFTYSSLNPFHLINSEIYKLPAYKISIDQKKKRGNKNLILPIIPGFAKSKPSS